MPVEVVEERGDEIPPAALFCRTPGARTAGMKNFRKWILVGKVGNVPTGLAYWSGYRPIIFTGMFFEPQHNILSNVRTNVGKYVVSWLEHSRECNRRYLDHS